MKKLIVMMMLAVVVTACSNEEPSEPQLVENGIEYVDLGLSVNWSSYNLGASVEGETGRLYAWGETFSKSIHTENNYTLDFQQLPNDISGSQYDAVRSEWGGNWRMPTKSEIEELFEKCIKEESFINGVKGIKFTANNGNYIFFPYYTEYYSQNGQIEQRLSYWVWSSTKYTEGYAATVRGCGAACYLGIAMRGVF